MRVAFDAESKKLTAATRKKGVCVRCRTGRKRVCYSYPTRRLLHTMICIYACELILSLFSVTGLAITNMSSARPV